MDEDEDFIWDEDLKFESDSLQLGKETSVAAVEHLAPNDAESQAALAEFGIEASIIPGKGRALIAKKDFKAGDCILRQKALSFCLSTSDMSIATRCSFCLQSNGCLKRCSKCKVVHYCSLDHQKKDWATHSTECPKMARCVAANKAPTATIVLLSRVFDAKARERTAKASPGLRFQDLMTLCSKGGLHSKEILVSFSQVARAFADFMDSETTVDMREVMGILDRFACNNHTICDNELRPIGIGVYPLAALANHSCAPSCTQIFRGSCIVFHAIRDIAKGEEITISYIDLAGPSSLRQKVLREKYLFECQCNRCTDPERVHEEEAIAAVRGSPERIEAAQKLMEEAKSRAQETSPQSLSLLTRALDSAESIYHPHNADLHNLRESAMKSAIDLQDWTTALTLCGRSVATYRFYYPTGSPLIGLQLAMLGKIEMYLDRLEAAREHLGEACEVLRCSHGADDPFVRGVEDMLRECGMALQGFGSLAST